MSPWHGASGRDSGSGSDSGSGRDGGWGWDTTVDVVVVGYGGAGASAALQAARQGASVVLAEKQPAGAHTPTTKMSTAVFMSVNDLDRAMVYLDRCAEGLVPSSVTRAWAARSAELRGWLERLDVGFSFRAPDLSQLAGAAVPAFEGSEAIDVFWLEPDSPSVPRGVALLEGLGQALQRSGAIEIWWQSPARRLVRDGRRIVGVELATPYGPRRVAARRGVILACGGYGNDEVLKRQYLKAWPVFFAGNPGNTGDGVRMAQDVGASLWRMNGMVGRQVGHFPLDGGWVDVMMSLPPGGYVVLDRHGRRFTNEYEITRIHTLFYDVFVYDGMRREYPRIPCYWLFDSRRMSAGPLTYTMAGTSAVGLYQWSADNVAEAERGWVAQADSVEELAARAGITDPTAAAAAVAEYNAACATGRDGHGRPAPSLVPLQQPPYYCVPLYPGGASTMGGPQVDEHARVLDAFGEPLAGLFAAGELGAAFGTFYPSPGAGLAEAFCMGQVAADAAVGA